MGKRKPLSKKIRFEVFKRDKFTCQYCGRSAPDVVLEVDHIKPVAEGGDNDIINLVTSCFDCNRGKGKRKLSDDSVVKKQHSQLKELQERKEQLDMMFEWKMGLKDIHEDSAEKIAEVFEKYTGFAVAENGMSDIKKWISEFSLSEILDAIDTAVSHYFRGTEETQSDANLAFSKISGICYLSRIRNSNRNDKRYYYVNYIAKAFRNKGWDCSKETIRSMVFEIVESKYDFETLKDYLLTNTNQREFWAEIYENYGKRYYV